MALDSSGPGASSSAALVSGFRQCGRAFCLLAGALPKDSVLLRCPFQDVLQ
jgi:hypothetical protein